jgi:ATP-dependent exoDNAse (exonuclease V) alpha subunit
LNIQIITRGKGKSAVAAAAYRAGTNLTNEYDGEVHDFTRKGGVVYSEIILPEHAPPEFADRSTLWNAVEKVERYKTAQLAREVELAFPYELTAGQNLALVRKYVQQNFVNAGMCASTASVSAI